VISEVSEDEDEQEGEIFSERGKSLISLISPTGSFRESGETLSCKLQAGRQKVSFRWREPMFTFDDMLRFATEAWGPLGTSTAHMWRVYNERYFGGVLRPVPLVMTHTQPFGRRLAFCSYGGPDQPGRTITVNVPKDHDQLLADNATLLHEMVHQCLFEAGEPAAHASAGWRREIMRLHRLITGGMEIWAGPSRTIRVDGKVVRRNAPCGETKADSLRQKQIARWPHDQPEIKLGALGEGCIEVTDRPTNNGCCSPSATVADMFEHAQA
jgi:hypothetical protein